MIKGRGLQAAAFHILSSGGTRRQKFAVNCARLAVQLAREDAGRYMHVNEIAGHALTLAEAGAAARAALEAGKCAEAHYEAARVVARLFYADVVDRGQPGGMVLGLRLSSASYVSGFENIFFVA